MTVAVVAEKPSVARDIARVLGASQRGEGRLRGGGYVVTWAIGHLVRLAEPPEIRPEWKRWAAGDLPLLPSEWPLVVAERTQDQFRAVKKVLRDPDVTEVVCATDAGREGELIFRYILEAAGCRKPVRRLWISSLTPEAIRRGFESLRPLSDFDPLADAARGRARADWLVGMNLSRAATLAHGELFSVGRVQTPTLALLVEREKAIRGFVPEDYLEVEATFAPDEAVPRRRSRAARRAACYRGTWFRGERPTPEARRLPTDGPRRRPSSSACGAGGRRWSRSSRRRAASRRRSSTTSPSCSATRTGSTAFPRRRRWRSRRRSTRRRSSSPTRAPTAATSRRDVAAGPARGGGGDRRALRAAPRPRHRRAARSAGASWTTRR